MKKMLKAELLTAMKTILQEYEKRTHETTCTSCELCKLYQKNYRSYHTCCKCPMYIFRNFGEFPCSGRRCKPLSVYCQNKMPVRLKAVIEFYEKAIEKVKSMTEEELSKKNVFKFLLDIDNEIADKYELEIKEKLFERL
jgi:hypothetical protein